MNKNPLQKQQGDVAIETIPTLPATAKRVWPKKSYVIAQGSSVGNSHVIQIRPGLKFYEDAEAKYCVNTSGEKIQLLHVGPTADHEPVRLNLGVNRFTNIFEMDHLTKMASPVLD
jgi:hypothetical protein